MSGPITRNAIIERLEPILDTVWGQYNKDVPKVWPKCGFTTKKSKKAEERSVLGTGFGLVPEASESSPLVFDTAGDSYTTIIRNKIYRMGFKISREAIDDNQYGSLTEEFTRSLKRSFLHSEEQNVANVFNRAFTAAYAGGDGKELCATDHPLYRGGTLSNEMAAASFSEAALEEMLIMAANFKNDSGLYANHSGVKLVHPRQIQFDVDRVLGSEFRVGTADNDINAIKMGKYLPQGNVVNQWLTSTTAYFLVTDAEDGLIFYDRIPLETAMEPLMNTQEFQYGGYQRYGVGWKNPRAVVGNLGA